MNWSGGRIQNNFFFSRIAKFISNNPLYKGVLVIGIGTVLAQMIGIITLPIITRIYSPTDMGILTIYTSILSIVAIAASFQYEFAEALPKKDEVAANLFVLCLIILIATSIIFSFVIFALGDVLIEMFNLDTLRQYIWLLIPGFFGAGLYSILNYWAIRQRDYRRITQTKINQSANGAGAKIIFGLFAWGPIGLVIGHIISQTAGIYTLARATWTKDRDSLMNVSIEGIKSVAREYWKFPVFNLPAAIVNALSLQLPALMLLTMYGSGTVGLYALAYSLMVFPGSIVSASLGQAFLGEVSKMVREGSSAISGLYLKTIRHLSLIAIPLIGILALIAPFITPVVFGESWTNAGWLCLPLALVAIPQFVIAPTSRLSIYGYNHWIFCWDITRVCGVIAGFYLSQCLGFPIFTTLTVYGIIMLIMYLINIPLNLKAIDKFSSAHLNKTRQ